MKLIPWPLFLALTLASACGDDASPTNQDLAAPDLAVARDLTAASADLTTGNCAATLACVTNCTSANVNTCVPACLANLSSAGQPYFDALEACAKPACYSSEASVPPCADPSAAACGSCILADCGAELQACKNH
jgi:hypothetical protein